MAEDNEENIEILTVDTFNDILSKLVGLSITSTTRTGNMECIKVNTNKDEGSAVIGDDDKYALHIQCAWRITDEKKILIGWSDVYNSATSTEYEPDFVWDKIDGNKRDVNLKKLIADNDLVINDAKVDTYGGFKISFTNKMNFEAFADESYDSYCEFWRLVDNDPENSCHYVSTPEEMYRVK
ncbi:hypothetical protein [Flavobacterium subsaxonicum]|uniref:Uncharacterized protein n=1 Tax=Flavobacterium subsaxonicum WB 4.1-42 = DSM 21790 TaxID=1121898 RepID=A0A0A2MYU0_9FLAO|nr:hypothetical protein [Flavobacterium subsaxonicum]KGO93390.1 hypothetical protein Q766_08815 [Flavobacterium subsaxonicum WB 4.1-42 = DSM 21790]